MPISWNEVCVRQIGDTFESWALSFDLKHTMSSDFDLTETFRCDQLINTQLFGLVSIYTPGQIHEWRQHNTATKITKQTRFGKWFMHGKHDTIFYKQTHTAYKWDWRIYFFSDTFKIKNKNINIQRKSMIIRQMPHSDYPIPLNLFASQKKCLHRENDEISVKIFVVVVVRCCFWRCGTVVRWNKCKLLCKCIANKGTSPKVQFKVKYIYKRNCKR